jgi:hypothetical protein
MSIDFSSFSGELQEASQAGQQHRQGAADDGSRRARPDRTHNKVSPETP